MAKKKSRAAAAVAGTKLDPERVVKSAAEVSPKKLSKNDSTAHPAWAPRMNSVREERTKTIFLTVEIVLVMIPVAVVAMFVASRGGFTSESLQEYFTEDPSFLVTFIAACLQPFVAYLLRLVHNRYSVGDAGYVAGNLITLLCSELALLSLPGIIGVALCLWRVWRNTSGHLGDWRNERGIGGVLFDISGALVVLAFALICAFANARIGMA